MSFANQISNRNFLSPVGFKFSLAKNKKIDFFSNTARIPGITLGIAVQPNYLKMLDVPGDILEYEDFIMEFLVDENMENYMAVHNWLTGLGFPESQTQFDKLIANNENLEDKKLQYSDGTLSILNSNYNEIASVTFKDLFPISLSSLEFNSTDTDINYFTAQVSFKYTIYNIKTISQ
jgi:hypothetical protein